MSGISCMTDRVSSLAVVGVRRVAFALALMVAAHICVAQGVGAGAPVFANDQPAPVNEFKGMQEREEVFAFAKKPAVRAVRSGGSVRWEITFATTAACDVTVAIVDKDGKIVRHLASGVLGANAPHPFQQNSLSQKIEWDGRDDRGNPVNSGQLTVNSGRSEGVPANSSSNTVHGSLFTAYAPPFAARVSLGLRAKYEKSIAYDPARIPRNEPAATAPREDYKPSNGVLVGTGPDGTVYVANNDNGWNVNCVVFDKDGKYLRTVLPPPAAAVERAAPILGLKLSATKWGDKVFICDWFGPFDGMKDKEKFLPKLVDGVQFTPAVAPTNLQSSKATGVGAWAGKITHMAADRARDEIYVGPGGQYRFSGKTGVMDKTWFADAHANLWGNAPACEVSVGADGLVYLRFGPALYGRHMIRLTREGKLVPFKPENTMRVRASGKGNDVWWNMLPSAFKGGVDAVFCGVEGHSFTHQSGLYAAPNGMIVMGIHEVCAKWAATNGIVARVVSGGREIYGNYNPVFDADGKLLSPNAVGETRYGQGVTMDRDGNIYTVFGSAMPDGQKTLDASDLQPKSRRQGGYGSLVKFRGQGGKFPLNTGLTTVKLRHESAPNAPFEVPGALWAYGGMSGQSGGDCQCHHIRHDMDFFARSFIPSTQLYSVTVLDANMNRIARFGRYGNVDDSEEDIKSGKGDGIRIAWMRAVAVSDAALYVSDPANRRILRAELSYAVSEDVAIQ